MKRTASAIAVGVVAALVAAAPLNAQYIFGGGGITIPVGDYKDHKSGWMLTAGVGADIGSRGLWIEAQGYYGGNKSDDDTFKTDLIGGFGALGYTFSPDAKVSPWVMGGVGILAHKFKPNTGTGSTDTGFAYELGAGLSVKAGSKANVWLGGQYTGGTGDIDGTKFISILLGVTFNLGN